jgi:hypothetical protein
VISEELVGQRVRIVYRMEYEGQGTPFMGVIERIEPHVVVLNQGDNPQFVRSYLFPERIVSIHTLREQGNGSTGEVVPEGTHPRNPGQGRQGR